MWKRNACFQKGASSKFCLGIQSPGDDGACQEDQKRQFQMIGSDLRIKLGSFHMAANQSAECAINIMKEPIGAWKSVLDQPSLVSRPSIKPTCLGKLFITHVRPAPSAHSLSPTYTN